MFSCLVFLVLVVTKSHEELRELSGEWAFFRDTARCIAFPSRAMLTLRSIRLSHPPHQQCRVLSRQYVRPGTASVFLHMHLAMLTQGARLGCSKRHCTRCVSSACILESENRHENQSWTLLAHGWRIYVRSRYPFAFGFCQL